MHIATTTTPQQSTTTLGVFSRFLMIFYVARVRLFSFSNIFNIHQVDITFSYPKWQRRTFGIRQPKADENAMSRHVRQTSNSTTTGPIRFAAKEINATTTRQALSEVTLAAVNRTKVFISLHHF
jgi:hypothetical protein